MSVVKAAVFLNEGKTVLGLKLLGIMGRDRNVGIFFVVVVD